MARSARLKFAGGGGWYHVYASAAAHQGEFPFTLHDSSRKLVEILKRFASVYFCDVAAFCVMGNHYHTVLRFEEPYQVEKAELRRRAQIIYPSQEDLLNDWTEEKWHHFEQRLFNVSELMRNVQGSFAQWYNSVSERKGGFWAERFKSTMLEDNDTALSCMTYIELNPIRAGIVDRPEQYSHSSLHLRELALDSWLLPLEQVMAVSGKSQTIREYKALVYYRGSVETDRSKAVIPQHILVQEEARGFATRGIFAKKLGYIARGVALGSEDFIRGQLERLARCGRYKRRKHPIEQPDGLLLSLREQRTTSF